MPHSPSSRISCHRLSGLSAVWYVLTLATALLVNCFSLQAQDAENTPESTPADEFWGEPQDLLKGELNAQWKHFSSVDKTTLPSVWTRAVAGEQADTELICSGKPKGYLYTSRQFGEFELNLEWRYKSDPNGNSGILVFTQNDRRLWPTSIQIQLHQPEAGSVFPSGDAVTDHTVKTEGLAKPVGEWNKCQVVSRAGRILVHVNGKKAGEVSGCKPTSGCIAIQSEGSVVHFRRITVRTPAAEDDTSDKDASEEKPDAPAEE